MQTLETTIVFTITFFLLILVLGLFVDVSSEAQTVIVRAHAMNGVAYHDSAEGSSGEDEGFQAINYYAFKSYTDTYQAAHSNQLMHYMNQNSRIVKIDRRILKLNQRVMLQAGDALGGLIDAFKQ